MKRLAKRHWLRYILGCSHLLRIAALENTQVGPFLILRQLGNNRRQKVYHARQIVQDRDVALKFIKFPAKITWQTALEKIQIEVKQLQRLRHENLVRIFGAGAHEGQIFFAAELIDGESLAALLSRRGKLPPDLVVEYGRQISEMLSYLHRNNLIHGALTPAKILITPDDQVKVTGLRFNQIGRRRWDASKQNKMDNAAYQAPEQFTEEANRKSDVYALGVVLFEMLTGKLPYELDTMGRLAQKKQTQPAPSIADHIMNCPIWLDQIVTRMLAPDHKQRPHSAREVVLAFEEIKNINVTGKSVASQISGNFNPLNKGTDKTTAQRVLGQQTLGGGDGSGSFFQSVPFLITALAIVAALTIWLAMPPSTEAVIKRTREQVESGTFDQWRTASTEMKQLMQSKTTFADEAEDLYYQARQKMLVDMARRGVNNAILQSEEVQQFTAAYQLEIDGESDQAQTRYFKLAQTVDPRGDQRHVFFEAKRRYNRLSAQIRLPDSPEELMQMVRNAARARSAKELEVAEKYLAKIFVKSAGSEPLAQVATVAKRQLDFIQRRKDARATASTPPPSDPPAPAVSSDP